MSGARPPIRPARNTEHRGCPSGTRCGERPWRLCIKELPTRERHEFINALRLVRGYLADPETVISG